MLFLFPSLSLPQPTISSQPGATSTSVFSGCFQGTFWERKDVTNRKRHAGIKLGEKRNNRQAPVYTKLMSKNMSMNIKRKDFTLGWTCHLLQWRWILVIISMLREMCAPISVNQSISE